MEEDISQARETTQQEDFYTYKLSKEERRMLAAAILINTKDHITLSQIADILYVSRATIINDLDEVKRMLESGKLKVISHSNKGLRLEGLEGDKRLFLLRLMSVGSNGIKEKPGKIPFYAVYRSIGSCFFLRYPCIGTVHACDRRCLF